MNEPPFPPLFLSLSLIVVTFLLITSPLFCSSSFFFLLLFFFLLSSFFFFFLLLLAAYFPEAAYKSADYTTKLPKIPPLWLLQLLQVIKESEFSFLLFSFFFLSFFLSYFLSLHVSPACCSFSFFLAYSSMFCFSSFWFLFLFV